MKKTWALVLGVGALLALTQPAQAAWMSCGKAVMPASCAVQVCYVDQCVTSYRTVTKERLVPVTVNKVVPQTMTQEYTYYECVPVTTKQTAKVVEYQTVAKQVPYTYYECVPVTTKQTAKVVEYQTVAKQVPYTYYECVPVTTKQTAKVVEYQTVAKQVPYTYYECVPVTTVQKRMETYYVCVPRDTYQDIVVCKYVTCQVWDPCTCCTKCVSTPVKEVQRIKRTVMENVAQCREVSVPVTSYTQVAKQGVSTVNECVAVTKDVTYDVTSYTQVAKKGVSTYTVYKCVPETVMTKQLYCETEAYQTVIKVPVCVPCCH